MHASVSHALSRLPKKHDAGFSQRVRGRGRGSEPKEGENPYSVFDLVLLPFSRIINKTDTES